MVSRWKVVLAAFVIFAAGAATGGLLVREYAPRVVRRTHVTPPLPMSTERRMEYVAKLDREVQLTPEQRQKVEQIIATSQSRMKKIWQGVEPQVKEEYRCSRKEIEEILTPEQLEKMHLWHKERYANKGNWRTNSPEAKTNTPVDGSTNAAQ